MSTTVKKVRVLCVEDDPQLRTFLLAQLKARGFQVQAVSDGAQAIDLAAIFQPQLILLDLSLPTLDGLEFLRRLREWSGAPVIVLSARDEELVKIKALDEGADETERLRSGATGSDLQRPVYQCGGENGLIVDFAHRTVRSGGEEVHLTPTEYDLLCELSRNAGKVLTHRELLQRVWGPDHSGENTYLRTFIRH